MQQHYFTTDEEYQQWLLYQQQQQGRSLFAVVYGEGSVKIASPGQQQEAYWSTAQQQNLASQYPGQQQYPSGSLCMEITFPPSTL